MAQDLGSLEKVLRLGEGRRLKRLQSQAEYVATLEPGFEQLSDEELAAKTDEFKQRYENGETLEELLFEAYAAVREAAKRALGQRPFDVQVMGGIVLHEGDIAEMKTGEGKTLVATQPLYLNALAGNGVHLVTVNDYLAKRDAGWMGPVYEKLGMRAAYIENMMPFAERKEAYDAEITYGTNSEFGFDYLRDNMAVALDGVVQRGHSYAIVDEVDSILIDEARTPLIISGEPETAAKIYYDYVIQDGEVKIVDEFTGRIMEGRRWSEGLHQAVEAKEGVAIQEEHVTLATITLQNYFRLYEKLGGMTGTAKTEEKEFVEIYGLHVVEIPTNVEVARADHNDFIFKTEEAKFNAVIDDIVERHEKGQPVLVGTIAVEKSEYLSQLLQRRGVPHNVLNAKEHERESEIIKDAGQPHAVTIATNMAGRGVDIKLGEGIVELGGLYVLGTERHEARRIDNQLRGRSGRQGDPGETRFYLSGQDELVRLFAGDRIHNIMERFKVPDDQPMEAGILSRQIENAQKKVEEQNFVARKNVLKYDDVLNKQRTVIYDQRRRVLDGQDLSDEVRAWVDEVIARVVAHFTENEYAEEWDLEGLVKAMDALYVQPPDEPISVDELREDMGSLTRETLIEDFTEEAQERYAAKEKELGSELMRELERFIILQVVDTRWREHLENMDYLRAGGHLRAMAQKDPLVEYTSEGHIMFEELNAAIREEVVGHLFHAQLEPEDADELQRLQEAQAAEAAGLAYEHDQLAGSQAIGAAALADGGGNGASVTAGGGFAGGGSVATATPAVAPPGENGPNHPCLGGSGQKVKKGPGALFRKP